MKRLLIPFIALAFSAPVQASTKGMSDYEACLYNREQINKLQPGLGDKSFNCERVRTWKSPTDRIKAKGGQTALIRKCESIIKPSLKNPNSYRYSNGRIVATESELKVKVSYRARNSFNAVVPETFTCTFKG